MASTPKPELRSFVRRMREKLVDLNELLENGTTRAYPLMADALRQLRQAMDTELKTQRSHPHPKRYHETFMKLSFLPT